MSTGQAARATLPQPAGAASAACFRRATLPPARPRHASAAQQQQQQHEEDQQTSGPHATSRRGVLLASLVLAGAVAAPPRSSQAAEEATAGGGADGLILYSNAAQGYTLMRPEAWEQVGKAGADALFRDPQRKSTTVGITVLPVSITSLEQFGDLQAVGERLLAAERGKESTLGVEMVAQSARGEAGGASLYDFEYELDSTRGRKRIMSTVTIANRKLYIANGACSCGKAPSCDDVAAALPLVRRSVQSLAVAQ